jgi:hypothetical protein
MQSSKPNAGLGCVHSPSTLNHTDLIRIHSLVLIENADVNDLIGLYGGESFSTTDTYGLINGCVHPLLSPD